MIYFKTTSSFVLPNGRPGTNIITQSCEDVDFEETKNNSVLVSRVTAKRICGGIEPEMTHAETILTLTQFNAIIKPAGYTSNTAQGIDADPAELEAELAESDAGTIDK